MIRFQLNHLKDLSEDDTINSSIFSILIRSKVGRCYNLTDLRYPYRIDD